MSTGTPLPVACDERSRIGEGRVRGLLPATVWCGSALVLLSFAGCAAYRIGTSSLYPPDIQTVYVPMFESDSFRRYLGERLTEAVIKEIELQTPYKVVGSPQADSVLTGRIINDTKRVIVENFYDEPRDLEYNMAVQVSWVDRKNSLVTQPYNVPVPAAIAVLAQQANLVPEYGQSVTTAQQDAIDKVARQIVSMMQMPW